MAATKTTTTKRMRNKSLAKGAGARPVDLTTVDGVKIARAVAEGRAKAFVRSKQAALAVLKREGILTSSGKLSRRYA